MTRRNGIDHIFISVGVGVEKIMRVEKFYSIPQDKSGSDHPAFVAIVNIPGLGGDSSDGASADGWQWPISQRLERSLRL